MLKEYPRILFFITDTLPTEEEIEQAEACGPKTSFRNANHVPNEPHALEHCDGVAGKVPPIYSEKYPTAEQALKNFEEKRKALMSKVGDVPAIKPSSSAPGEGSGDSNDQKQAEGNLASISAPGAAPSANPGQANSTWPQQTTVPGPGKAGKSKPAWHPNK